MFGALTSTFPLSAQTPEPTDEGALKVQVFRAQFDQIILNIKGIGEAIKYDKVIQEAERGLNSINQITSEQWAEYASIAENPGAVPDLSQVLSHTTSLLSRVDVLASALVEEPPELQEFPDFADQPFGG